MDGPLLTQAVEAGVAVEPLAVHAQQSTECLVVGGSRRLALCASLCEYAPQLHVHVLRTRHIRPLGGDQVNEKTNRIKLVL